ncbi:MAG: hypothetical protein K9L59_04840 [Desulfobacterales bacterium]|nr:hypothetical protein [Desulfobacterales bacterium]
MSEPKKSSNVIPIDAREAVDPPKSITRRQLINRLNFINFQDGTISAVFQHSANRMNISVAVKPQPCCDEHLKCFWDKPESVLPRLDFYVFSHLSLEATGREIRFAPELVDIDQTGMLFRLQDNGIESIRQNDIDLPCHGIQAQLIQHGAHFRGRLRRFNAARFVVELTAPPPQTFQWIQNESPVHVIFSNNDETLYTGECKLIDQRIEGSRGTFTLEPNADRLRRFEHREFRSERHSLVPSPHLFFRHPFSGALTQCTVMDVSGAGFCVEEVSFESALPAGLILPSVKLDFAGMFQFSCKVQVVYRNPRGDDEKGKSGKVFCGLAILDIHIDDHTKLMALINHVDNQNCYVCNQVDLDALWDFFFETGFIYPEKYVFLRENKDRIKRTYEKLYNQPSTIARHFTYQEGARILGHVAMLRFYHNAWMIHHHAGNTAVSPRAGLEVLRQIGYFTYNCHRLHAIHMDYLICYFRPENKFPARVFGRIAKNIADPKGCSLDCFAYYHYRHDPMEERPFPPGWEIEETDPNDLHTLGYFYEERSGGLLTDALDLVPQKLEMSGLSEEYHRLGFRRERYVFSLKKNGMVRALIIANQSNVGMNLSDLTSAINIIAIEPEALTREVLNRTLHHVAELYDFMEIPVLMYPDKCLEALRINGEKRYNLWILKMSFSDHYFRHLNRMLRFVK